MTSRGSCALPRDVYQRHRNIEYQAATPRSWTWRLLSDLSLVEGQLITLQDVAVTSTALAGSRGDDGVQTTSLELSFQSRLNLAHVLQSLLVLVLHTLADLLLGISLLVLLLSSSAQRSAVVSLIPRSEWCSINLNDGRFSKSIRSDEFVVGRVESDDDDTGLSGDTLAAPAEVASVESQTSELSVAAAGSDEMDALVTNSSVGWLPTFLEGSAGCLLEHRVVCRVTRC